MRSLVFLGGLAGLLTLAACGAPAETPSSGAASPVAAAPGGGRGATADRPRIVFLGDSLTAGLGLPAELSYPARLQARMAEEGYDFEVVNAGVSGDTSAGGLRRLDWSLEGDVRILVVALGANDGLRGLSPAEMRKNLTAILDEAARRGIDVLLAGMEAPPNFGSVYTREFRAVYADLARRDGVRFLPFLLQGVAGEPSLNQPDGIHPNARGAQMVADLVWDALKPAMDHAVAESP